jgi:hypothetical protein
MRYSIIILIILTRFPSNGNAQVITAGSNDTTDIYTDPIPFDSCWSSNGYGDMHSMLDTFILDIDRNGTGDYKFTSSSFWSMYTGGTTYATITPLNSQNFIITKFDTITYYTSPTPSTAIYKVPIPLNSGDLIPLDSNYNYTNTANCLSDISPGYPPSNSAWDQLGEHFIGIMMIVPNDTLFGWIRVSVENNKIIINDYACNRNPNFNYNSIEPVFCCDIFPNPAENYLEVANNQKDDPIKNITFWSIDGIFFKEVNASIYNKNITIDISELPSSVYIIQIETTQKVFSKKIIVH